MPKSAAPIAKLSRPRLYDPVPRERLFVALDALRRHPVVWIAGRPGAGKTTLAASWLESRALPFLWLQADAGDGDPSTFFFYLRQATALIARRRKPLSHLSPEYLGDLDAFARRFFREMFTQLPADAALVIDNFHDIPVESVVHRLLRIAASEVPPGATMILISRTDPPEAIAPLLANQTLTRLPPESLGLTLDESSAMARRHTHLTPAIVAALHGETGGWAAGLVLLLESARQGGHPAAPDALRSRQTVFDYFASQVFDPAPAEARLTLAATALLPSFDAEQAIALSGNPDAAALLDFLHRHHLFTDRQDASTVRFRYHDLFRAFLLRRLEADYPPATKNALARHAARLAETDGDMDSAFRLHCDSGDWPNAIRVLLDMAPRLLGQGRWRTLHDWLDAIPGVLLTDHPWLDYWRGTSLINIDPNTAMQLLERTFARFEATGDRAGRALAACGASEATYFRMGDFSPFDRWIPALAELLEREPDVLLPSQALRVKAALFGARFFRRPRDTEILPLMDDISGMLGDDIPPAERLRAGASMVIPAALMAQWARGDRLLLALDALVEADGVSPIGRAHYLTTSGYFLYARADHDAAVARFERAERLAMDGGLPQTACQNSAFWGDALNVERDFVSGKVRIDRTETLLRHGDEKHIAHYLLNRTIWHAGMRQRDPALSCMTQCLDAVDRAGVTFLIAIWNAISSGVAADFGDHVLARTLIEKARNATPGFRLACIEAVALMLDAYLCNVRNDAAAFKTALRYCLVTCRRDQSHFFWRWFMADIAAIVLNRAIALDIEAAFAVSAIRQLRIPPPPGADARWPWPVRIHAMGAFDIEADGMSLAFARRAPKKLIALLKAIVAFGGRNVPQLRLIDALWSEDDRGSSAESLTVAIHRLRKLLGSSDVIEVQDGCVSLDDRRCWCDTWALMEMTDPGKARPGSVPAVLAVHRGPFLDGDDSPWVLPVRERLKTRTVSFVSRAGRHLEDEGDTEAALDCYRRGLEVEDLAEDLHRGVIRCLQRLGRDAEAVECYQRLRRLINVSLGVEPSALTRELMVERQPAADR